MIGATLTPGVRIVESAGQHFLRKELGSNGTLEEVTALAEHMRRQCRDSMERLKRLRQTLAQTWVALVRSVAIAAAFENDIAQTA